MRWYPLVLVVGCANPPKPPPVSHHIEVAADVRWPLVRRTFHGTIRQGSAGPVLELREGVRIALPASTLAGEVSLSGLGRAVTPAEAADGAMLALADIRPETHGEIDDLTDLDIALPRTWVMARGTLVEHGEDLALLLDTTEIPVRVTVDGVDEARSHVGERVRIRAYLMPDGAKLALGQPTFL